MSESGGFVGTVLGAGAGGVLIGAVGTIIVALINQQAPLAALVDARIRVLIEGYEKRIDELKDEIIRLEGKVEELTRELHTARGGR
jgi:HAMP domain-containing protein